MPLSSQLDAERPSFKFCSPEGHQLLQDILKSRLPYEPHNYQIEGVCQSLDGVSLVSILPTGGGKTGFFLMYMLALQAISQDPALCPTFQVPRDPCMIVAYPTVGLEEEMVSDTFHFHIILIERDFLGCCVRETWSLHYSA